MNGLKSRAAITISAAVLALTMPTRAEQLSELIVLSLPSGRVEGELTMPRAPVSRPPVVYVVADGQRAGALGQELIAQGVAVATLRRLEPSPADAAAIVPDAAAQWVTHLRNDERLPIVVVYGEGASLSVAAVAARAARADGLVTGGPKDSAAAEIARLVAPSADASSDSVKETATKIAAFAKGVPAFGRRGAAAVRPTTGRRSPRHTIMTTVGGVRVAIEWGQPQMRGREIWGALVPWNAVWMPGADEATTLTTNGPITLGTFAIPAGDHTLFATPAADTFQLMISKDVGQFHTVHDMSKVIGRVEMAMAERPESVEGLTYAVDADASGTTATFKLMWDKREYSAHLTVR